MKNKKQSGLDDKELVQAAKSGDLEAFEELVARYERKVYSLARRICGSEEDAQDVTQQSFLSAMQNLSKFHEDASFYTWLATITANTALKVVRKRRGLPTTSLDEATEPDDEGHIPHPEFIADWRESTEHLINGRETRRLLDSAISELAPKNRAVFLLRDVEELSVRDTSEALHLSESNVKVRLLRARLQLRELLTRQYGDDSRRYAPVDHGHKSGHQVGELP